MHAGRPWQQLALDLVAPLPTTDRGNQWILVLTDHFSRWQDALAIPDATAMTVATTLEERVFCYFGLSEQVHTDQGTQFEGELLTELCSRWHISKSRTTPYHPQGNGVVERGNRTLGDTLRTMLLHRSQEDWDLFLPQIMRAYRATPHSITGLTANLLLLGREVRLPDQLHHPTPLPSAQSRASFIRDTEARLMEAHQLPITQGSATRYTQ